MSNFILNGHLLRKMIIAGANELDLNRNFVDSLNVFPVPDGDTGTNMSLTVLSAAREIENVDSDDIGYIAKLASTGALKGARGNSGVILSQLFRGFAKGLENVSVASNEDLALACMRASQMAYKAVMKPKEGTILTMAREIAEKIAQETLNYDDLEKILISTIIYAKKILTDTTEMLPQLKQAGVVDSGARGLLFVIEGAFKVLNNTVMFKDENDSKKVLPAQLAFKTDDIKFCYEVLFDINNISDNSLDDFKNFLSEVGDSLVVTNDNELTKIHIHTNETGLVIEKALKFSPLLSIKIENLKAQHDDIVKTSKKIFADWKDVGFVAVSMGSGFHELFENLGVDEIIEGGQTMNPSTEDILNAIEKVNADKIIVLPNNKNIILAAQQAADLSDGKQIFVLPTKTIPQGLAALLSYVPENDDFERMNYAIESVKTGQITYAVRDTKHNDQKISQGDILCMFEDEIVFALQDLEVATKKLVDLMLEDGGEVLTIYFGKDVSLDLAQNILDYATQNYPQVESEIHNGEQPLYYFIISVE